jgi:hypothetical protein
LCGVGKPSLRAARMTNLPHAVPLVGAGVDEAATASTDKSAARRTVQNVLGRRRDTMAKEETAVSTFVLLDCCCFVAFRFRFCESLLFRWRWCFGFVLRPRRFFRLDQVADDLARLLEWPIQRTECPALQLMTSRDHGVGHEKHVQHSVFVFFTIKALFPSGSGRGQFGPSP